MKPKVSIIVPIYNVEAYLSRCLDSLLSQTMKELEIIAVNDGSTDGCIPILDRYADQDDRLIVIHQANSGVSAARNVGIRIAQGEYIGFVDPDDWVETDMYDQLYRSATEDQADIVMCSYTREFGTHAKVKHFQLPDKTVYRGDEVQSKLLRRLIGPLKEEMANPEFLDAWGTVWSKLYRSELIKENGIGFIDLAIVGTNEDSLFNIHTVYHARSFVFLNRPYYHYWRVNAASLTSSYKADLKDKWFRLYGFMESFIAEKRLPPEYSTALNNRICLNTLGLGLNTINGSGIPAWEKIKKLSTILHDSRIKSSFEHFEAEYCPVIWRVFYWSAKLRFVLGYYVMLQSIEHLRKMAR
ncbi:glycosyltransferase [Paenibacillus sp. NPDC056579]|uniref:glycosyltransferase n=1 Tax=Paenibacillus sp. NPDC056579 TaxID=3345871 RepID=UPI0036940832